MKTWLKTTLASVGILGSAMFALTGCGVKTDIKNNSSDILFNGGIVSVVGDHLVFSNGYKSDDISTIDNYNDFAKITYLAAVNSSNIAEGKFKSPEGVKNLKSEVLGLKTAILLCMATAFIMPHQTNTKQVQTHTSLIMFHISNAILTEAEKKNFSLQNHTTAQRQLLERSNMTERDICLFMTEPNLML